MGLQLGIHTGPQNLSMEELVRLWKRADAVGFHWISIWDHFYANPLEDRRDPCFEAVAALAGLAAVTQRARVGCLVFCSLFRSPGLLAKAAVTIDHLSGGRAELGIGAGWFEEEFRDFGYAFPPIGERLDRLEETLQVVRSLLRDPVTRFEGKYFQLDGAVCAPKPLNPGLRIWVGGQGPRRTPALAARYADGYNAPYLGPKAYAERLGTLDRHCEAEGRAPGAIARSVNLHFRMGEDAASAARKRREVDATGRGAEGSLLGTPSEAVDLLGEYERVGAQGVNIAFRPPIDWEAFEAFIAEVLPVFHAA